MQSNLAQFKLDLQTLRKAVATLKQEQQDLTKKPVQQVLTACKVTLQLSVLMLIFCLVDIFFASWVHNYSAEVQARQSVVHLATKMLLFLLAQVCFVTDRLCIHDNQAPALAVLLCLIPLLMYTIKVSVLSF